MSAISSREKREENNLIKLVKKFNESINFPDITKYYK